MQRPIPSPIPRSTSPIPVYPQPEAMEALLHSSRRSPPPDDHLNGHSNPYEKPPPIPVRSNDIPWKKLIPIQIYRIADSSSYTVIFPFVTAMITSFDVPRNRIGLYGGMAEGSMMLFEAVAAPVWAKAADKYGRRACMNWGYFACLIPAAAVGFSNGPFQLLMWRTLFGLINPIGVIGKIQASEISHPGNRAKIFSIFSPGFAVGSMMGTLIGGEFSQPYGRLPHWLGGDSDIFRRYPYGLPCLVLAIIGLVGTCYGFYALPETRTPDIKTSKSSSNLTQASEKAPSKISYAAAMRVPRFALITALFCCYQLTVLSWDGMSSVWLYTDIRHGGLNLTVEVIGFIMAANNLMYIFFSPYALPRLQKRYGVTTILKLTCCIYPLIACLMPVMSWSAGTARPLMWMIMVLYMAMKCFAGFAWPLCDQLTTGCFDEHPHLLATGSAISLIAGAFGRAIGPAIAGWIYSISTEYDGGTLGRNLPWLTILLTAVPSLILAKMLNSEETDRREGYEAVPMMENGRHSTSSNDEDDGQAVRVSAVEV